MVYEITRTVHKGFEVSSPSLVSQQQNNSLPSNKMYASTLQSAKQEEDGCFEWIKRKIHSFLRIFRFSSFPQADVAQSLIDTMMLASLQQAVKNKSSKVLEVFQSMRKELRIQITNRYYIYLVAHGIPPDTDVRTYIEKNPYHSGLANVCSELIEIKRDLIKLQGFIDAYFKADFSAASAKEDVLKEFDTLPSHVREGIKYTIWKTLPEEKPKLPEHLKEKIRLKGMTQEIQREIMEFYGKHEKNHKKDPDFGGTILKKHLEHPFIKEVLGAAIKGMEQGKPSTEWYQFMPKSSRYFLQG